MIRIAIVLMVLAGLTIGADAAPRLHCTSDGKAFADLRKADDGHYYLRIAGKRAWSKLHDNAVGMGLVMLWAGGVKCAKQ